MAGLAGARCRRRVQREMEALEHDVVGLEEWAATELRDKGRQKLRMMRLYRFGLRDDLGTRYVPKGSGHGGRPDEMTGNERFEPPTPSGASVLTLSWSASTCPSPSREHRGISLRAPPVARGRVRGPVSGTVPPCGRGGTWSHRPVPVTIYAAPTTPPLYDRAFDGEIAGVYLTAGYVPGSGWSVVLNAC